MNKTGFKHNRKRNTGLIYEFLIRKLSLHAINKDSLGAKKTISIIKKYFGKNCQIAKEHEIHNAIVSAGSLNEISCRKFLADINSKISSIDSKILDIKKNNLIKEINYTFGKDFFSEFKINDYKLYASVQMYIDACKKSRSLNESKMMLDIEQSLIKHMMQKREDKKELSNSNNVDSLACGLALRKFNNLYSESLNSKQKIILREFIKRSLSNNEDSLNLLICKESIRLIESLKSKSNTKELNEDSIMKERFNTAINNLRNLPNLKVENAINDLMLYQKLEEELTSNEK